jgi:hypothetical protein
VNIRCFKLKANFHYSNGLFKTCHKYFLFHFLFNDRLLKKLIKEPLLINYYYFNWWDAVIIGYQNLISIIIDKFLMIIIGMVYVWLYSIFNSVHLMHSFAMIEKKYYELYFFFYFETIIHFEILWFIAWF